jgi:hypothetical protein
VGVIRHDGIGTQFDGKDSVQLPQAFYDPGLAMFIAFTGEGIGAAEEGATQSLPHEVFWAHSGKYSDSNSWYRVRLVHGGLGSWRFPP